MSSKMRRGFYRTGSAWYADALKEGKCNVNEVMFGLYEGQGGTDGEMGMRWHDLGTGVCHAARLECFDNAFTVLMQFTDVIERLAQTRNISEPEFVELLIECGFEDLTPYAQGGKE